MNVCEKTLQYIFGNQDQMCLFNVKVVFGLNQTSRHLEGDGDQIHRITSLKMYPCYVGQYQRRQHKDIKVGNESRTH